MRCAASKTDKIIHIFQFYSADCEYISFYSPIPLSLFCVYLLLITACTRDCLFCTYNKNLTLIYTVGHKKRDTFIFSITLANIDRFS